MVVNYQNGKIYCLRSHQTDDIYIGSTTQPLSVRMAEHRRHYKHWKEGKRVYISSFQLLEYDDCYIELIEKFPCDCRMELERREGQLIREMDCVNKVVAGRTPKEYRDENREKIAQCQKQYREENKEQIARIIKQYYEDNKERLLQYQKEYRRDNKEKIAQYEKQRYGENKEQIAQRKNKKMTCECGCTYTYSNKARHYRSNKHQQYLASIE